MECATVEDGTDWSGIEADVVQFHPQNGRRVLSFDLSGVLF